MAINSVSNYPTGASAYQQAKAVEAEAAAKAKAAEETEETKSTTTASTTETAKEDAFVKSQQYKVDMDKVNSMKASLNSNVSAFKMMVQGLFQKQGTVANNATSALSELLNIDKATQESAQAAIAEDGEWGVEQTAQRILDFAMALSGGDPSKAETLRGAVEQGFKASEKIWGGELPEISYKTYDRVMQGFDEWVGGGKAVEETTEA